MRFANRNLMDNCWHTSFLEKETTQGDFLLFSHSFDYVCFCWLEFHGSGGVLCERYTHTHTHTHNCEMNEHNAGSGWQTPRQLDRQTSQSIVRHQQLDTQKDARAPLPKCVGQERWAASAQMDAVGALAEGVRACAPQAGWLT